MRKKIAGGVLIILFLAAGIAGEKIEEKIRKLEERAAQAVGTGQVDLYNELAYLYLSRSPDKALENAALALKLAKKADYPEGMARALRFQGTGFFRKGNREMALESYQASLETAEVLRKPGEKAGTLNSLGNYYLRTGEKETAQKYYQQSLAIREEMKDPAGIADVLNNLGNLQADGGNFDSALEFYERSLKIRRELGNEKDIAGSLSNIGNIYEHTGDLDKSLGFQEESLQIRKRIGDTRGVAISTNNIGLIHWRKARYDQALEYFLDSLKITEQMGDDRSTGIRYHNMALICRETGDYPQALQYNEKALASFQKIGFQYAIGASLNNIGNVYDDLDQVEKSLEYHLQSLKIREEIGDREGIATSAGNAGNRYKTLKRYPEALECYRRSVKINQKIGSKSGLAHNYTNLAGLYTVQGDYKTGFEYLEKALSLAEEVQDHSLIRIITRGYSDAYRDLGRFEPAYRWLVRHMEIKDRIINQDTQDRIAELQTRYETEKKEKEIALLKKNTRIQDLELKQERLKSTLFIIGFTLSLVLLAVLVGFTLRLRKFWKGKNYIGHFRIQKKLGRGSMGEVYQAVKITEKDRPLALKVIHEEHQDDPQIRSRFKNEAVIIDQLDHPHIVKVYERGEFENRPYIAMELLSGRSLEEVINGGERLPVKESLEVMHQMAQALSAIHQKGVYHCDIKPGNIMLTRTGDDRVLVKLLDFDIARSRFVTRHTEPGYLMGTLYYLPPEYIAHREKSAASDIYSFGVVCYELLTFERPFLGEGPGDILRQIQDADPLEPRRFRPDIPEELNRLILRMMSKGSDERPGEEELLENIESIWREV